MHTRTGPHTTPPGRFFSRYSSGSSSSLSSFNTPRLITCQRTSTGRTFSTSSIQREVSQAHGQDGSNQKSAGTLAVPAAAAVSVTVTPRAFASVADRRIGDRFNRCPACHDSPCSIYETRTRESRRAR
ncbi:hypothetical protein SRIMM317S_06085 [Streptomyces rimosus subsp. rimosus]